MKQVTNLINHNQHFIPSLSLAVCLSLSLTTHRINSLAAAVAVAILVVLSWAEEGKKERNCI